MRCLNPHTVGRHHDGKTLCWSSKSYSRDWPTFQLPCSKCIVCRLEYARQVAVRCVHEAKMHEQNSFITLTYSDKHLKSSRLVYHDFQNFIKKLRKKVPTKLGVLVTGEYGDLHKRPHWHSLLFGYQFPDLKPYRKNKQGDQIYTSQLLDQIWGKNDPKTRPNEVGEVTFESAGYCARYAAKKLIHGHDQNHNYHPIHKRSSKNAIGKKFIEAYWPEVFNNGYVLIEGQKSSIPRYYVNWLEKHHPQQWLRYIERHKLEQLKAANDRQCAEHSELVEANTKRFEQGKPNQITRAEIDKIIITERFNRLKGQPLGDI